MPLFNPRGTALHTDSDTHHTASSGLVYHSPSVIFVPGISFWPISMSGGPFTADTLVAAGVAVTFTAEGADILSLPLFLEDIASSYSFFFFIAMVTA